MYCGTVTHFILEMLYIYNIYIYIYCNILTNLRLEMLNVFWHSDPFHIGNVVCVYIYIYIYILYIYIAT